MIFFAPLLESSLISDGLLSLLHRALTASRFFHIQREHPEWLEHSQLTAIDDFFLAVRGELFWKFLSNFPFSHLFVVVPKVNTARKNP